MAIIKIERQTESELVRDEPYDKLRTKRIYFFGLKVFDFKWTINNPKDNVVKQPIGFNKTN